LPCSLRYSQPTHIWLHWTFLWASSMLRHSHDSSTLSWIISSCCRTSSWTHFSPFTFFPFMLRFIRTEILVFENESE
jgi:hypothetical protein